MRAWQGLMGRFRTMAPLGPTRATGAAMRTRPIGDVDPHAVSLELYVMSMWWVGP